MNSQREVIYRRRRNALFGERLQLDILNMLFDTCDDLVANAKAGETFGNFKVNLLGTLGLDFNITEDEYASLDQAKMTEKLYEQALNHYETKNKSAAQKATTGNPRHL
ncbi:MAG: hypothetical protein WDN75_18145 [Bacteroidota bacterium]